MEIEKERITRVIEERLSPLFAVDGGRVDVVAVNPDRGIVRVRFDGTYRFCPGRDILIRHVIEPTLRREFPALRAVEWTD